ncbi:MAG: M14 family metallopeptidase [Sedimenticola sp.]
MTTTSNNLQLSVLTKILRLATLLIVSTLASSMIVISSAVADDAAGYFSGTYQEARYKFLQSAQAAGARVESYLHPDAGPDDLPLYTDVALIGPNNAESVLVLASGTHGVEGFAGSAVQAGVFHEGIASQLPPKMQLIMIHAVNPYGFAHGRRFNEDNVDINRNFVNHSKPYPGNPGYEALADIIFPQSLSFWEATKARVKLLWYRLTDGRLQLRRAISHGQFTHPDGLFFGGNSETWSNKTLYRVIRGHLLQSKRVVFIGFHTGLGEYAAAEVIMNVGRNSPAFTRAIACWGDLVRTTMSGESVSIQPFGPVKLAIPGMLPQAEVTAVSLEFGTFPISEVFWALRAENWLHNRGGPEYPERDSIRAELLTVFYPADASWKQDIWNKGKDVIEKAIYCLGELANDEGEVPVDRMPPNQ